MSIRFKCPTGIKELHDDNVKVSKLVGDDASTISHLRQEVNPAIEKGSDKNHVKKNSATNFTVYVNKVTKRCLQRL